MKYFLCLSLILLCFSLFKCQETEDSEDFETEDVDPVDTNEEEDEEEPVSDLDLIPSLSSTPSKGKGKRKGDSESEQIPPLTSFVSTVEKGTVGLFGKLRDRLTSRVQQVGSHLQDTQQSINKRFQNGVTDFMQGLGHQLDG